MASSRFLSRTSKSIITITFILSVIGLITVYSASLHSALPLLKRVSGKQAIWMLLGLFTGTFVFFVQKSFV